MSEPPRHNPVEDTFSRVAEGRMPQVMPKGDGLRQVLIEPQGLGDGPGDLRNLEGVSQAGSVVVSRGRKEDLSLVLQTPERLAMDDTVPIVLKGRADIILRLWVESPPGLAAQGSVRGKDLPFFFFQGFSYGFHGFCLIFL